MLLRNLSLAWLLYCVLAHGSVFATEQPAANYLPLAIGNRWDYESSEGTPDSPVTESWEVTRREGEAFVVQITQPYVTSGGVEELLFLTVDGIKHITRETGRTDAIAGEPQLLMKTPLTVGATWENRDGKYAVTAIDETVTVPAGTFTKCIEITHWSAGGKVTVTTTYAPNTGMVQREEKFPVIGGIGGFDSPERGRTMLRLKSWSVQGVDTKPPVTE